MHQKILILDFGSQYTQLIARRAREANVYCEIYPYNVDEAKIREFNPIGIILSGGPRSVFEEDSPRIPQVVFDLNVPVLGICYGMHAMALQFGGDVAPGDIREYGHAVVELDENPSLLSAMIDAEATESDLNVWMSHGDSVSKVPDNFRITAKTSSTPVVAMQHESLPYFGVQFHPEVTHTRMGDKLLHHFLIDICGARGDWRMSDYIEEAVENIRKQVGSDHVLLGLSGGVDSSVVAALLHRAIGDQLTCIFVDHGLLRLNEGEQVMKTFADNLGVRVIHVDATHHFLSALAGFSDPETKRKIIGREFITVFQQEAEDIPNVKWLAQGTIYPDVIESAADAKGTAHTIKSHHNVGGLPDTLSLKLLEPIRLLFKDEVRQLGLALGLPREMIFRHPFPGPGLGVRVLGEVREEYLDLLRLADAIFIDELHKSGWYDKVAQAFAVFLPVKSVGVMGDGRTYEYVVALRAVRTTDFMTAEWAPLPYDLLAKVSNRIINEVRGINRVVYDISSKPPATIEWE